YVFSSPGVFHPDCHISTNISEERSGNLSTPQTTVCKVYHQWNNRIDEVISEYGNKSLAEKEPVWNILNAVQQNVRKTQNMECCGRYNVTQWEKNKNKESSTQIPCSCTKSNLKKWFCDISRNSTYSMGCEEHLDTWFENNVLILNGISISLLITQVRALLLKKKYRNFCHSAGDENQFSAIWFWHALRKCIELSISFH
ncbi:UNVERIFIED_CONTAM: hypothetical protein H355_012415, partial [Colinus virginianus]